MDRHSRRSPPRDLSRDREPPRQRSAYHSTSPGPPPPRSWERRPPPPARPERGHSASPPPPRPPPPRDWPQRSRDLLASPSPSPRGAPLRRVDSDAAHPRPQRPARRPQYDGGADENHRRGGLEQPRPAEAARWHGGNAGAPRPPPRGREPHGQGVRDLSPRAPERDPVKDESPQPAPEPSESGEIVTSDEEGLGGKEIASSGKRKPDRAAAAAAAEMLLRRSPSVSDSDIRALRKAPSGSQRGPGSNRDVHDSGRNVFRW